MKKYNTKYASGITVPLEAPRPSHRYTKLLATIFPLASHFFDRPERPPRSPLFSTCSGWAPAWHTFTPMAESTWLRSWDPGHNRWASYVATSACTVKNQERFQPIHPLLHPSFDGVCHEIRHAAENVLFKTPKQPSLNRINPPGLDHTLALRHIWDAPHQPSRSWMLIWGGSRRVVYHLVSHSRERRLEPAQMSGLL